MIKSQKKSYEVGKSLLKNSYNPTQAIKQSRHMTIDSQVSSV